ncbi:MAG: exo-alpha-sialidase [Verrucomicrobiae bacterium]|nr:exo-alpha-sialidase [Verrucomicrobiae bacterium]
MDPQTARQLMATAGTGHLAVKPSSQGRRLAVLVGILLLEFGLAAGRFNLAAAAAPVVVGPTQAGFNLIVLPDGAWELYDIRADAGVNRLIRSRSNDHGRTWTEPETLRELPIHGGVVALLDRRGEVQLFVQALRTEGDGKRIAVNRFIDIWQLQSSGSRRQWSESQRIFEGYVGSVQGALQLRNGRIILPFAYWVADRPQGPPTGANITTVVYSDDEGQTWRQSAAQLTAPCEANYNGSNYGAIEPTVLQLKDGRVWMLMRTQAGFLYESHSEDGAEWSEALPSRFRSSTGPAFLLRLPDDRIALFWNHCELSTRVDGQGVYGGRDVLHAAISDDEGRSWRGFREVYRDPFRNHTPPRSGDRGTAYPFAVNTKDGRIALVSGQGGGRRGLVLVNPDWLLETQAADDFSNGLAVWSVFKGFGSASGWWRDRVPGARLMDHPTKPGAKVLHLRKPDDRAADGAVWNFPSGTRGTLTLRLKLNEGFAGAGISLLERFLDPTDDRVSSQAAFHLPIDAHGHLGRNERLTFDQWHTLEFVWDVDTQRCRVQIDGKRATSLRFMAAPLNGLSYLHLRSQATEIDPAGFLIESVQIVIGGE